VEARKYLCELVAIPSVNPSLEHGGAGETGVVAYAADRCRAAGFDARTFEAAPGRPNLLAVRRGAGRGPALLLTGHADTVGVAGMTLDPFSPAVRDGRLYGRGALDMKAGLAAILAAVGALPRLAGDVWVGIVADEEYASAGTEALLRELAAAGARLEGAVLPEPTDLALHVAHKGFVWLEVELHGRAAHGGRADLGVDAIAHLGAVLDAVRGFPRDCPDVPPAHPLLGAASVHASTVEGGLGWSTYPDRCLLRLERRTLPGETAEGVLAEWRAVCDRLPVPADVRLVFAREPFAVSPDARILRAVQAAAAELTGSVLPVAGRQGWIDAALLGAAGIDTAVFGPRGGDMHGAEEWVDLASLELTARLVAAAAERFCGLA
jgi:acetylornithine deacetylase